MLLQVFVRSRATAGPELMGAPQLTVLCDDSTEVPAPKRVILGLIDLCDKRLIPQGYHAYYNSITTTEDDNSNTD